MCEMGTVRYNSERELMGVYFVNITALIRVTVAAMSSDQVHSDGKDRKVVTG